MTLYEAAQLALGMFGVGLSLWGTHRFRRPGLTVAVLVWLYLSQMARAIDPVWMVMCVLVAVPMCTCLALGTKTRSGNIIALATVAHLPVYALYSLGLIDLDAVWLVSSVLLNVQIVALYAGIIGGGMGLGATVVPVGAAGDRGNRRAVVDTEALRSVAARDT